MSTLTVYCGTAGGEIHSSSAGVYSDARGGDGTRTVSANPSTFQVGQWGDPRENYSCWDGFLDFDTSSIGDGDVIDSAELSLWASSITDDDTGFTLGCYLDNWGTVLGATDWTFSSSGKTLCASLASSGFNSTSAYKALTSSSGFLSSISKTGITYLTLMSSRLISGLEPDGDEHLTFYGAGYTGTTRDPKLVVEYHAPTIHYGVAALSLALAGTQAKAMKVGLATGALALSLAAAAEWTINNEYGEAALALSLGMSADGTRVIFEWLDGDSAGVSGVDESTLNVMRWLGAASAAGVSGAVMGGTAGDHPAGPAPRHQSHCPRCGSLQVDGLMTRCRRCRLNFDVYSLERWDG